jgi:hypothetical protein
MIRGGVTKAGAVDETMRMLSQMVQQRARAMV